jgi:16S rRNA G527 N7-methylase RsmG
MIYLVVDDKGQILVLKATEMKEENDEANEKMKAFFFFYQILFFIILVHSETERNIFIL